MLHDIRYAFRSLIHNRGYAVVATVALALGIGMNAAVFTLVDAVLFRGLPFHDSGRIVMLLNVPKASPNDLTDVSLPDFRDWRNQAHSFEGMAAYGFEQWNVSDATSAPESAEGAYISANGLALIGAAPVAGRDFNAADERADAPNVAIIGYDLWNRRYARSPATIGMTVQLSGDAATIIGVMPPGFRFPLNQQVWVPLRSNPDRERRDNRWLNAFGRLRTGVSRAGAQSEMNVIAGRLAQSHSEDRDMRATVTTFNDRYNGGNIRTMFLILLGAVGCVLLVACANVSNLALARALSRNREIVVRSALGAGRWRIVRQLLVESVLLGCAGGVLGLGLAAAGVHGFSMAVANVGKPYWIDFSMDFRVYAYLAAICVATGVVFGLTPALHASRVNLADELKEGARSTSGGRTRRFSHGLVAAEMALSLVLLTVAGLMMRSFVAAYAIGIGNDDRYSVMQVALSSKTYPDAGSRDRVDDKLLSAFAALPGVNRVVLASGLPMISGSSRVPIEVEGQPIAALPANRKPASLLIVVSPGYFATLGKPMLVGREFNDSDGRPASLSVIVNQRFAQTFFPHQTALGRRLRVLADELPSRPWLTVVGVAPDIRSDATKPTADPQVYLPNHLDPMGAPHVIAAVAGSGSDMLPAFRRAALTVDPSLPIFSDSSLREAYAGVRWPYRVFGTMFAIFAVVALVLAAVGLYGVIAFSVAQRTAEFGIRMALGASPRRVLAMVVKDGLPALSGGLALGLAGALAGSQVMRVFLIGITPRDPLTLATVCFILTGVALLACWVPARAASRLDPMRALRRD